LRAPIGIASPDEDPVTSWSTIVELQSIYKRLRGFEAVIRDEAGIGKLQSSFMRSDGLTTRPAWTSAAQAALKADVCC